MSGRVASIDAIAPQLRGHAAGLLARRRFACAPQ